MTEQELRALATRWQAITDREERNRFYDQAVFPAVKQVVIPREQAKNPEPYEGLILPIGLSPEPIILSILTLRPQKVYLLYTKASEPLLDQIVSATGLKISQVDKDEIDETNVPDIYRKIKLIRAKWQNLTRIAVDMSGGKKSMVGGCALAGAMIGARLFYIDSDFIQELRKPRPGSEHLAILENPYDVFGDIKFERALRLFEQLDYNGAQRLLSDLKRETSSPEMYEARVALCQAYAAWDDWQIDESLTAMKQTIDTVERYQRADPRTPLSGQLPLLHQQFDVLSRLQEAQRQFKTSVSEIEVLGNPNLYWPMIATLYAGALRQERRGKRDVAALLWYRLIELMGQQRLGRYQLSTGQPDYSRLELPRDELQRKYQAMMTSDPKKPFAAPLPEEISLLQGYALLMVLDDSFVRGIHIGKVRQKINARNKGLFAHGFAPLSEADYTDFKKLAEDLLGVFKQAEQISDIRLSDGQFIETL